MWARVRRNGDVRKVYFRPQRVKGKDFIYPPEIFRLWTPAELAAIRIYPVIVGTPIDPATEVEVDRTYAFDGSNVIETINKLPRNQADIDREIAAKKYARDVQRLKRSNKNIADILEQLISVLLTNAILVTTDLDPVINAELALRTQLKADILTYEATQIGN